MEKLTRRLFLRNTAAAGAVGVAVAAPVVAETLSDADERAVYHWQEFQRAVQEMLPTDARLQVFGGCAGFRVEALCKEPAEVRPRTFIDIERIDCAAHYIEGRGWVEKGRAI